MRAGAAVQARPPRRTARTNYFDYDDERLMVDHLDAFRALEALSSTRSSVSHSYSQSGAPRVRPPPAGVFELLQSKFGFQHASVANQKENFACWIANSQLRVDVAGGGDPYSALWRVHQKFFKNYIKWCKFLGSKAHVAPEGAPSRLLERQIALFLCIWGEAANLRFMPECICFLYHSMATKLDGIESLPNMDEGYYLQAIVRPAYEVIAKMRTAGSADANKPVDHEDITNYDDLNEFFWTPECLDFDELNIADALKVHDPKTFKEKRSVFNPLLAFFRIWFFLLVAFHVLLVIAYVGYYTRDSDATGLAYYGNWFASGQSKLRKHAVLSVFLTVTALLTVKVVLQIWLYGLRIFKDVWLAFGVFFRLAWHTMFFAMFALVYLSPLEPFFLELGTGGKGKEPGSYLSTGGYMALIYSIPVLLSSLLRMFFAEGVWGTRLLNSLDGTRRQYIGREMGQPWKWFGLYGASWSVIFFLKFLFTLELMIRPLVGPSIELYNTGSTEQSKAKGVIQSNHNLFFIAALWAPILLVYLYDTQIWFILYQSIVGLVWGLVSNMGQYTGIEQMKAALYTAPDQFDKSVASVRAQGQRVSSTGEPEVARTQSVRLRFAIIWNEVISSFRLNDLLDDRETVILQYRVLNQGHKVENPIFVLAGKVNKAVELATKARPDSWSTEELNLRLNKARVMDGVQDALNLTKHVFHLLLGNNDHDGPLEVLEYICGLPDAVSVLDFQYLPALVQNMIDLLSVILDLPDDLSAVDSVDPGTQEARVAFQDQTRRVIDCVSLIFRNVELLLENDATTLQRLKRCAFVKLTTDLTFQKQQLLSLYKADATADSSMISTSRQEDESFISTSAKFAREDFVSSCTRLFFLLRLDLASSQPRCEDARRRLSFFLHTLTMEMPKVTSVEAMPSFSVMTPYYSETVMFTIDELKNPVHSNPLFERIDERYREKGRSDLTIMGYLITFHAEEWSNFLERMGVSTTEEALTHFPKQVRLWASLRGQTLARTVYGMMMYEDALRLLRWLELWNDADMDDAAKVSEMNHISSLKFSYVTGCQIYSQQIEKGDHRADDIDYLMKRFPSWRVSFVDAVKEHEHNEEVTRFYCVLVKSEGEEIVEVYRYELPGNPILGEGKPENQNVALPFTRGEYLQTIDMNQEHYFEEALKMPNFLATAAASGEDVTIIGMKEHVFTGRASSLARFMTLQELVFVTMTQRVLAQPLRSRMHYGHPDVFEKSFVMTNGGVSKASKGINLSEDVFSGYNVTLRGGLVTHVEFMQCGKGRDVTLSQINAFEAKLSNGCAESCLSREGHRMSNSLDFFRLNSMYYGHFGFYICNAMTVLCVYVYAYSKLYVATHSDVVEAAATNTKELDSLAKVMSTQYVLQFGLLTTLPLLATLIVEFGWKQAVFQVMELVSALGIVFYVFLTGTKAHFYDVALIRGGSKYRGTGRGFAITRDPMVNFFKEYGVSHFRKAVELIGVMILYGVYGEFDIGVGAREEFCKTAPFDCSKKPDLIPKNITSLASYGEAPQSYGVASFAVLLLGACWLMAPFLFNTDGLVLEKTKIDVANWFAWMMRMKYDDELIDEQDKNSSGGTPSDGWLEWWEADVNLMSKVGPMGRLTYMIRELRHLFAMYFVFVTEFSNNDLPYLFLAVLAAWGAIWVCGYVVQQSIGRNQKHLSLVIRGVLYMVLGLTTLGLGPMVFGVVGGWSAMKGFTLSVSIFLGLNAICQFALALHGFYGLPIAMWTPFMELGFLFDMLVGVFLVVPLLLLSFMPFMRILQTRMMYNGGFARALSSGSEVAASICILVGLMGGYVYGFMSCYVLSLGFINDPKYHFINRSFQYFVTEELNEGGSVNLAGWVQGGKLKALCAMLAVIATIASFLVGKFLIGRRMTMGVGCASIFTGLVLNFINDGVTIIAASCLIAAGSVFLSMNYLLYSFEICTKGWRGKGVTMFLIGSMIGYITHAMVQNNLNNSTFDANWTNKPSNNWRTFPMFAVTPVLMMLVVAIRFIPESPIWFMTHGDTAKGKEIFIRLRRRLEVRAEMTTVEGELKERRGKRNLVFRVGLAFALQFLLAIVMSNSLLKREVVKEEAKSRGVKSSSWMVIFGFCSVAGIGFSVFLIDNVRRKTILKDFVPFLGLVSIICGSVDASGHGGGFLDAMLFVLFIGAGLSLQGVTWLSSLEMFGAANRPLFFSLSMGMFHAVQGIIFYFSPSFAACHLVFGFSCLALTLLIFGLCASTKLGAIQLKSEKQRQKEEAEQASSVADPRPSTVVAEAERQDQQQQARIAQVSQPSNAYIRSQLSSLGNQSINYTGTIVDRNTLMLMGLNNMTSVTQDDEGPNAAIRLSMLNRRQTSELGGSFNYSVQSDDFDEDALDLLLSEITNPVDQPRSLSFLQSRTFPDSQVHAETRGRGLL